MEIRMIGAKNRPTRARAETPGGKNVSIVLATARNRVHGKLPLAAL